MKSSPGRIPAEVLSQALGDKIAGRRVRTAVFTTFSFDPGFFELHVLPVLFDQPFSQAEKVVRIQLEEALCSLDEIAVYYDRSALAQDAEPAQLDYQRIDTHRPTGVFHTKLILLLVEEPAGDDAIGDDTRSELFQSLLVGTLSANLTRAGWWENVECAHFEEIRDRDLDDARCPFRPDLLSLLKRLHEAAPSDPQPALDRIREFLLRRTTRARFKNASSGGAYYTRLFSGQGRENLAGWLGQLRLGRQDWNLEVISPYFDPGGAGPLEDLIEAIEPRQTRVHLPRDLDGTARVSRRTYEAVRDLAAWGQLPGEILARGRTERAERLPDRRVHAKVYRFWRKDGRDLLLVGSTNLTHAAHSHAKAGNLEASFLVDVTDAGYARRWWLHPLEGEASRFLEKAPDERDGLEECPLQLTVRYDWATRELHYRLESDADEGFEIADTSGQVLFEIRKPESGRWTSCGTEAARKVEALLPSSSFLLIRHAGGSWRVLVREENMGYRPSLLTQLTPEEILEYWALLTPAQRAAFIESRVEAELDGIQTAKRDPLVSHDTIFDRFAGIYHAFGCLRTHVEQALDEDREREAEARLLGAKYDSLPSLLQKTMERQSPDPVVQYVTFLCARQLRDSLRKERRSFFAGRKHQAARLDELLGALPQLRRQLALDGSDGEFLDWYETTFLKNLGEAPR